MSLLATVENIKIPLTEIQKRFLRVCMDMNPYIYTSPQLYRLTGIIDSQVFEQSLKYLVQKHELLRSAVHLDNEPYLYIQDEISWEMGYFDFSSKEKEEGEAEARTILQEEIVKIFDLENEPLFRFTLFKLDSEEYLFYINLHHIISDAYSWKMFNQEIRDTYARFYMNDYSRDEMPTSFLSYVLFQKERLDSEKSRQELSYWKNQLKGVQPISFKGGVMGNPDPFARCSDYQLIIPGKLHSAIKKACLKMNTSVQIFYKSVYLLFLSAYTGKSDITIGANIADRVGRRFNSTLGLLVNDLVMRFFINDKLSFQEFVGGVSETVLEAYSNSSVPYEEVVKAVRPGFNKHGQAFFNTMFIVVDDEHKVEDEALDMLIKFEKEEISHGYTELDWLLAGFLSEEKMRFNIRYNTAVFDESKMSRFEDIFLKICETVSHNHEWKISSIVNEKISL